jgi:endonuclease/exonuclease/phosphatase family metal-dependent hydrolase
MRFVSWNQGYNTLGHRAIDKGWRFLLDELHSDVLLLQETTVPAWVEDEGRGHMSFLRAWPKKAWGSLVLTPTPHEVVLEDPDLRVIAVKTKLDLLGEVLLASFHARIFENRVIPHLRRSVEAVLPLLDGRRFIVGGDLNTSRAAVQFWPGYGHAEFFDWTDSLGWHDCHWQMHSREQMSLWSPGSRPLQADHIFTDSATADHIREVSVLDDEAIRRMSDHGPLVVDVNTELDT